MRVRGDMLDQVESLVQRVGSALGRPCVLALCRRPTPAETDPPLRYLAWTGLPPTAGETGRVPSSWSPCAVVSAGDATLALADAAEDPRTAGCALVRAGDVRAYLGAPVRLHGLVAGVLHVFDDHPVSWAGPEVLALELAAERVGRVLEPAADVEEDPAEDGVPVELGAGALVAGRWRITADLGAGGQGSVWLALEEGSGRRVALKVGGQALAEARRLASVSHPHLVAVHAADALTGGGSFLVMDHVDGPSLEAVVGARSLDDGSWVQPLTQVAGALTALHAAGLVHGDVKASNVLVDAVRQGAVLVDLGLGLALGAVVGPDGCGGTVGCSAPEQFGGLGPTRLTPAADTYGLATLAWRVLSHQTPFERPTRVARVYAQLTGQLDPFPPVLAPFRAVFEQAAHPDPARRFPSPLAFVTALQRELRGGEEAQCAASVIRAVRAAGRRLGAADAARAHASLPARSQAAWAGAETSDAPVPSEVLVAWLRSWSNRSGARLHDLGWAAAGVGGADVLRGAFVLNDPASLLAGMSGLLPRMFSWAHLAPELVSVHETSGTLVLPSRWLDALVPFLSGWLTGWFSGAGADLAVEWSDGPSRETAGLRLAWSRGATG